MKLKHPELSKKEALPNGSDAKILLQDLPPIKKKLAAHFLAPSQSLLLTRGAENVWVLIWICESLGRPQITNWALNRSALKRSLPCIRWQ